MLPTTNRWNPPKLPLKWSVRTWLVWNLCRHRGGTISGPTLKLPTCLFANIQSQATFMAFDEGDDQEIVDGRGDLIVALFL